MGDVAGWALKNIFKTDINFSESTFGNLYAVSPLDLSSPINFMRSRERGRIHLGDNPLFKWKVKISIHLLIPHDSFLEYREASFRLLHTLKLPT